jgi:ribosomal-protein-alanine N-acetyltransferase
MSRNDSPISLTPPDPAQASLWHVWRGQRHARRYMPIVDSGVEVLAERLRKARSDLAELDHPEYRWMVSLGGEIVGTVAATKMSTLHGTAEISYHIDEGHHQSGVGTDAVGQLVDKLYRETPLNRLFATISRGNDPSCRLVEKLSFVREGALREHFMIDAQRVDQFIYGLLRAEWEQGRSDVG